MDLIFDLSAPELSALLCAISLALIPLMIWAFWDIDRRRQAQLTRRRLQRLSVPRGRGPLIARVSRGVASKNSRSFKQNPAFVIRSDDVRASSR
jgi:hypothetical protein